MLGGFLLEADALAGCAEGEEPVASCQIARQEKQVSVCLSGDAAVYRFGPVQGKPEMTLRAPLMEVGYLRADGAGQTIDETVVFPNEEYAYQASFGFRAGLPPDPTELRKFGTVKVLRKDKTVAELACAPETIIRKPDLLLDRMRKAGRKGTSDGVVFNNYEIEYPGPVSESPPCKQDFNVDTCWSQGISAARGGDPALALGYFDKSCDADLGPQGCYEAGKLYLQSRALRDYGRAYERFTRVCSSDDVGQGPYACKYLGWMHHTGIGAEKDPHKAWSYLSQACFTHNEALIIDAEGCHFFAEAVLRAHPLGDARRQREQAGGGYLAYLALAMGCADDAKGICAEAKTLLDNGKAVSAAWIARCDEDMGAAPPAIDCAGLITPPSDYETNQALRRQIFSHFQDALGTLGAQ